MPQTITTSTRWSHLKELYGELHDFGKDLKSAAVDFQQLVEQGAFKERGKKFQFNSTDPANPLNRSIDITRSFEFLVAVTGAFSSGKSTLLNLLLGNNDLLPSSVIPMTAVCTAIRHGNPRVEVRYVSREECFRRAPELIPEPFRKPLTEDCLAEALECPENFVATTAAQESLSRLAAVIGRYDEIRNQVVDYDARAPFIAGGAVLETESGARYFPPTPAQEEEFLKLGGRPRQWVTREWLALIRDVSLWSPSPLLENDVVLLDLPGLNCREDYHRRAIREYCNMADCIMVTAFQPGNQADQDVLESFRALSSNYQEKVFFVFNKVDQFAAEPHELARAVDYLARDTIGRDFPEERFFLTSAMLAKSGDRHDLDRLRTALKDVEAPLRGFGDWVERVIATDDAGGVGHLRRRLQRFLIEDAYPVKTAEIVRNLKGTLESLSECAQPELDECRHLDAQDLLRGSLMEYFQHVEKQTRASVYRFRFDYLRGHESNGHAVLKEDLKMILEGVHDQIQQRIESHFERPILSAPLREDPVSEFDLLRIADDASQVLRRDLQELILTAVHERVSAVLDQALKQAEVKSNLENLFRGAPEWVRRFEHVVDRFKDTLQHSLKCIVRNGFFYMPRGRELKRLERPVPLADLKDVVVQIFNEFYPNWIYERIYAGILDNLWLSLFLDAEDFDDDLEQFFGDTASVVPGAQIADHVVLPERWADGRGGRHQVVRLCQKIEDLQTRHGEVSRRGLDLGGIV